MPEAYGVANFRRESLPILPPDFQLIPRQVKAEKGYKADPGVLKQLKVIKEVFDQCDKIIVATDAGREGELIFRYIFHYLNCRKPFVRLWISSLTDKAIREGLDNLQPGERYDNLYLSAKSRSEADWLIGINATQALSVAAGALRGGLPELPVGAGAATVVQAITSFSLSQVVSIAAQHFSRRS